MAIRKADSVVLHETTDPEVIIAEFDLHRRVLATGRHVVSSYIMVIRVRDGLIVSSRDYADPLVSAQVLGKLPDLVAAYSGADADR